MQASRQDMLAERTTPMNVLRYYRHHLFDDKYGRKKRDASHARMESALHVGMHAFDLYGDVHTCILAAPHAVRDEQQKTSFMMSVHDSCRPYRA